MDSWENAREGENICARGATSGPSWWVSATTPTTSRRTVLLAGPIISALPRGFWLGHTRVANASFTNDHRGSRFNLLLRKRTPAENGSAQGNQVFSGEFP